MTALSNKKTFYNLFPTPEYLLLSTCGLSITDESIKFIQFQRGLFGNGLKFTHYERVLLPDGIVSSGYINNAEALTSILKTLALKYGIRYARATFPEERAYLFTATIEKVPAEGLRDAVAFILEENVPVKLADSVFNFDVVEDLTESNQLKVIVSVLSKNVADFYIQAFEAAGIIPVSFDIESQAIARAVVPMSDKLPQLIVNLNARKTGFYVVENGVVQFTTTLPYESGENAPYPHLNDLKIEMRKIFAFWNARPANSGLRESKIEKVILSGPGALNDAFVIEFMNDCPVEHTLANVWLNTSQGLEHLPKKEITEESLEYSAAIGLILPRTEKNMFKLLTEQASLKVSSEYAIRRMSLILLALIAVLIIGLVGLLPSFVLSGARKLELEIGVEMLNKNPINQTGSDPLSWLSYMNTKLQILSPLLDETRPSDFINKVMEKKSLGIRLTNFAWVDDKGQPTLSISGVAQDRQALLSFEGALKSSQYFSDVALPVSNLAKDRNISFQIKLSLASNP